MRTDRALHLTRELSSLVSPRAALLSATFASIAGAETLGAALGISTWIHEDQGFGEHKKNTKELIQ